MAAYLVMVALFVFSIWRVEQVRLDDRARGCVAAWERTEGTRNAIDRAATVPTEALIAVVADADPAQVDAFRAETKAGIDAAVAEVVDPACDLDAAMERLDG